MMWKLPDERIDIRIYWIIVKWIEKDDRTVDWEVSLMIQVLIVQRELFDTMIHNYAQEPWKVE